MAERENVNIQYSELSLLLRTFFYNFKLRNSITESQLA